MEKYLLGFTGAALSLIFGFWKGAPLEVAVTAVILVSAACVCKKLEEIRDKWGRGNQDK